jgi:hypothetical protein
MWPRESPAHIKRRRCLLCVWIVDQQHPQVVVQLNSAVAELVAGWLDDAVGDLGHSSSSLGGGSRGGCGSHPHVVHCVVRSGWRTGPASCARHARNEESQQKDDLISTKSHSSASTGHTECINGCMNAQTHKFNAAQPQPSCTLPSPRLAFWPASKMMCRLPKSKSTPETAMYACPLHPSVAYS